MEKEARWKIGDPEGVYEAVWLLMEYYLVPSTSEVCVFHVRQAIRDTSRDRRGQWR